jgi:hypothetical protein
VILGGNLEERSNPMSKLQSVAMSSVLAAALYGNAEAAIL